MSPLNYRCKNLITIHACMVADLCQSTICRLFVMTTRQQNDNYRLFAPKRRQNDKTTKRKVDKTTQLGQKDDKHNPLISDLICCLFAWRKDDKTKRQQNEKTTKRKDNKTKRRQNSKRKVDKYIIQPANLSSFRSAFCRLAKRKDDKKCKILHTTK
jgi:hypothetical protein